MIRALGPQKIPIYLVASKTKHNLCSYSRYVRATIVIDPEDPNYLEKLTSWGLTVVGKEAVLIVAGGDEPLDVLSRHLPQLPAGWRATFPNEEIVRRVRKKEITYALAMEAQVPIPKTYAIKNKSDLEAVLRKGDIIFPALMKSEKSAVFDARFGTKGLVAESIKEIERLYDKYDSFMGELLLQEMIIGGNETLQNFIAVYDRQSKIICGFSNRKVRVGKEFSSCTLMENFCSAELERQANELVSKVGYFGYANTEFKFDARDQRLKLMEINGRVSMSNSHALLSGVNLPMAMYRDVLGIPKNQQFNSYFLQKKTLWWFPVGELSIAKVGIFQGRAKIKEYFQQLRCDKMIIEPFCLSDPMPGLFSLLQLFCFVSKFALEKSRAALSKLKLST